MARFDKRRWPQDGPVRELLSYLDGLHTAAGLPSMAEIGRAVALARSTVAAFFNGTRLISRGNLELVVEFLGGDAAHAEALRRKAAVAWGTPIGSGDGAAQNALLADHGELPDGLSKVDKVEAGAQGRPSNVPNYELGGAAAAGNLPRRNHTFTGRARPLAQLREELTRGRVTVVAVRGMGGIGKTQLALEYAHQQRKAGGYNLTWWVRAESPLTLAADLAALAPAVGVDVDTDQERTITAVLETLRQRDKWLLIFDNAPNAQAVRDRLPPDNGHILITSRDPAWGNLAHLVDLPTFTRAESVTYLLQRAGAGEQQDAEELAAALGDLPLALAQVAAYLEQHGGLSLHAYLRLYRQQKDAARQLVADLDDYPESVATTWKLHFDDIAAHHPAALQLLRLCAFVDPDDIDLARLLSNPDLLTGPLTGALADAVADPVQREAVIGTLARTSLISRIDGADCVRIHRLVAQVTRTQPPPQPQWRWPWQRWLSRRRTPVSDHDAWADHIVSIINALFPDDPNQPASWVTCAALAAHASTAVDHSCAQPAAGALMSRLGQYLHIRAELKDAGAALHRALDIYTEVYGPDHTAVAEVLTELGALQRQRDQLDDAHTSLHRALDTFTRVHGPDHASVADVLTELGRLQRRRNQLDDARTGLRRALDIVTRIYGPDHAAVADALTELGAVQRRRGRLDEAQTSLHRALDIFTCVHGPDDTTVAWVLTELGALQRRRGQLDRAHTSLDRALNIFTRLYGPDHTAVADVLTELGALQRRRGRLDHAHVSLHRALDIYTRLYSVDDTAVADVLTELGALQRRRGQLDHAHTSLHRALDIFTLLYGPDHAAVAWVSTELGALQRQCGQLDDAHTSLHRALEIFSRVFGADDTNVAWVMSELGRLENQRGQLDDAGTSLHRALEIFTQLYGPNHYAVADVLTELGRLQNQRA